MQIIDNFLTPTEHQKIQEVVCGSNFPWYFLESISAGDENSYSSSVNFLDRQYGFFHILYATDYSPEIYISEKLDNVLPLINKIEKDFDLKREKLIRVRAGMQTNVNKIGAHYPHIDRTYPHKTFLYYVNSSDGGTIFYKEKYPYKKNTFTPEIINEPSSNQLVSFDGFTYHSSSSPIQWDRRVAININYRV